MPALRFGIDFTADEAELNRREEFERIMFRRAPARLLCLDQIDTHLQTVGFFRIWTHEDATAEYAVSGSSDDETAVFLRRDWAKQGVRHISYLMCITDPVSCGKGYFRIRSITQLRRALKRWAMRKCARA